jgi:hypothetical protein
MQAACRLHYVGNEHCIAASMQPSYAANAACIPSYFGSRPPAVVSQRMKYDVIVLSSHESSHEYSLSSGRLVHASDRQ